MPQQLELLSSSSFGMKMGHDRFHRPAICIFPHLFTCAFYARTHPEDQESAEARASTTVQFGGDPRQPATFTNVPRD